MKDTFNIQLACLNLIKGESICTLYRNYARADEFIGAPMPLDLASVLFLPSRRRQLCFLSIALGLMVDLDIGTENMRWMGDTRFILGFVKGVAASKNFKCRLKMKVVESDKVEMARLAREAAHKDIRIKENVNPDGKGLKLVQSNGKTEEEGEDGNATAEDGNRDGPDPEATIEEQEWIDDGPLDWAESLQPDDTWLCIDSTTSRAASRPHVTPQVNTDGAWRDGDGMLYM